MRASTRCCWWHTRAYVMMRCDLIWFRFVKHVLNKHVNFSWYHLVTCSRHVRNVQLRCNLSCSCGPHIRSFYRLRNDPVWVGRLRRPASVRSTVDASVLVSFVPVSNMHRISWGPALARSACSSCAVRSVQLEQWLVLMIDGLCEGTMLCGLVALIGNIDIAFGSIDR